MSDTLPLRPIQSSAPAQIPTRQAQPMEDAPKSTPPAAPKPAKPVPEKKTPKAQPLKTPEQPEKPEKIMEDTKVMEQNPTFEQPAPPPLRVLFAASECVPFVKTGGLADVIGALPKQLKALGADVRVILPKFSAIPEELKRRMTHICDFPVPLGWRSQYCGIEALELDGIPYYFVDNEYYFNRSYIYGHFCNDEAERFAFFSKGVLDCMPHIGFFPNVLHAHDWQAAMSIALLKLQYDCLPDYSPIRTLFTIHNLRYQGVFDWPFVSELLSLGGGHFRQDCLEYYGKANFMKAALVLADAVTTVSPSYAWEIQTSAYGETLDGVLRARGRVSGIMNGLDEHLYDPATDPHIAAHFSPDDLSGKAKCKRELQEYFHLDPDPEVAVVGMVTRLTDQKGLDLIEQAMEEFMNRRMQFLILGTGDRHYEQLFSWACWRWPGRVGCWMEHNPPMANRVYAGSDMFLMPSQFEPCGLAQLIALRYGSVPIVRETGGLKDSIIPYNKFTDEGLGFTFANYDVWDMLGALNRALESFYDYPASWRSLMTRGMRAHFTWDKSARQYMDLYRSL